MNKIVIYRTHIEINDYTLGDNRYLEKQFSVWDKLYHRAIPKGMIYDSTQRKLMLPRGTDIMRLERTFNSEAIIDYSVDPYRNINPIGLKYAPRDQDQKEAICFMLGMPPYENNKKKTMLSLNLNTGKGKSYCAIATVAYLGIAPIIIADTVGCLEQWKNYFLEYTDIKANEIFHISGTPSINKLRNRDVSQYKVFLVLHATLKSYGDSRGWDELHEFFKMIGVGIKIYDEAHLDFDNMMSIDSYTNTFISYYLTATPARSNFEENTIFQIYFNGVPNINLFHEDIDPHTAYVGMKFNSCPSPMDITKCKNAYGMDRIAYTNYVVNQENFHSILHILINKALNKPGKCLWYIGTNEAILIVRDWIYENYPELVRNVGIYSSIIPKEFRKAELDKKIILSTTKSAGAAMDIPGLVEVANIAEPFKSRVLAQQTLGRTRDRDTIYKDLVDLGFPQTKAYYNFKRPVFMKYATDCKEVILRQSELDARSEAIIGERNRYFMPVIFEDDRPENKGQFVQKYYNPVIFDK